jgi:hypothetical protein
MPVSKRENFKLGHYPLWYRSVISNSERQRSKAIGLWLSTASLKRCPDTNLVLLNASAGMLEQTGTAAL